MRTTPVTWISSLAVGALLSAGVLGLVLYLAGTRKETNPQASSAPPDPREEYDGPFRNVRLSVRYVPEQDCAGCHADIARTYAQHPMGRSLFPIAQAPAPPTESQQKNPFEAFGSVFRVESEKGRARHRRTQVGADGQPAAEQMWEVHYVIGSGTRGYSYLSDRDGYLFQTPISWYSQKQAWDLSPGFGRSTLTGRAVVADCLFCHANRADAVEGTVNRYRHPLFDGHAIGCQRCHGPGEIHLAGPGSAKGSDGADLTIVNPGRLEPALRDAVCEQCHLQGAGRVLSRGRSLYDFRPGLPLTAFWKVFVRTQAGQGRKAIGQVEQMHESRCYQGGQGPRRLGCISCHDPHQRVADEHRVSHYRAACNQCHESKPCSLPEAQRRHTSPKDSCIDCHMPRYGAADVPHTATTDHRILRRPKSPVEAKESPARTDSLPVVSFFSARPDGVDEEEERARAVLVMELAVAGDPSASRAVRAVLPTLEAACRRDASDHAAAEARGYALTMREQSAEALSVFEELLKNAPERELALAGAALAAEEMGRLETALEYWRRAAAVNPWSPGYRRSLALALVKQEMWPEAQTEAEAWIRLDPFSAEARASRLKCLLATGDKAAARAEFARIEALAPPNLPALRIQFAKKLR
jgi:hypothetical protein